MESTKDRLKQINEILDKNVRLSVEDSKFLMGHIAELELEVLNLRWVKHDADELIRFLNMENSCRHSFCIVGDQRICRECGETK